MQGKNWKTRERTRRGIIITIVILFHLCFPTFMIFCSLVMWSVLGLNFHSFSYTLSFGLANILKLFILEAGDGNLTYTISNWVLLEITYRVEISDSLDICSHLITMHPILDSFFFKSDMAFFESPWISWMSMNILSPR